MLKEYYHIVVMRRTPGALSAASTPRGGLSAASTPKGPRLAPGGYVTPTQMSGSATFCHIAATRPNVEFQVLDRLGAGILLELNLTNGFASTVFGTLCKAADKLPPKMQRYLIFTLRLRPL